MPKLKNTIKVAIDGPAGAGKSTVARACAKKLGYIYIDTGALYRAVALFCLSCGRVTSMSESDVTAVLPDIHISVEAGKDGGEQQVFLNDENVTQAIRRPDISPASSKVSAYPAVREFLLQLQRDLADTARGPATGGPVTGCIMDGRDIASTVLPNADVKIFLTASAHERARRRKLELEEKGIADVDFDTLLAEINKRDYDDSHRAVSPLTQVADAVLIDTGNLTFEQSISKVTETILKTIKNV